jgi:SecD/SecF fusion protein
MSKAPLWLKFSIVGVLVVISAFALYGKGLRKGLDIVGGYSMIFEFSNPDNDAQMGQRIKDVLTRRLDPQGLSGLEIQPLQGDRIGIRMPAASDESRQLRNEFVEAREQLLETNIERSEVRDLLNLSPEKRQARVKQLSLGSEKRAELIRELFQAMSNIRTAIEQIENTQAAIQNLGDDENQKLGELVTQRDQARQAKLAAEMQYDRAMERLQAVNITSRELQGVLNLYDEALARSGQQRDAAMENFEAQLETFKQRHPAQVTQINNVIGIYREWAEIKRPLEDPNDVKRLIRKAGVLEFRIAPRQNDVAADGALSPARVERLIELLAEQGPEALREEGESYAWYPAVEDAELGQLITADYQGRQYVLLSNKPNERLVRPGPDDPQWQLASARRGADELARPAVNFEFDSVGSNLFGQLTSSNQGKAMAILLDDEIYSAPVIRRTITGSGQIEGNFTVAEVDELVRILQAGSLPARLNSEPIMEHAFSAALGQESINQGYRSAIYALIAVAVFMLIYYLLAGAIADVALLLNLIFLLGAMSLADAPLSLPGIAGLILTVGIAVDANVLIFERLREEQAKGQSVGMAIKNAYDRAFSAIIDANLTTLLICLFLYVVFDRVGMREIRGFAVTLGLGVTFSLFTALVVTRWIFELMLKLNLLKGRLPMLRLVPQFNVNWMSKRYLFWGLSLVMMVAGIGALVWQGRDLLGIEFRSGTQAVVIFRDDAMVQDPDTGEMVLPADDTVRARFSEVAAAGGYERLFSTARVEAKLSPDRVESFLESYGTDGAVTRAAWQQAGKNPDFFTAIDANGDNVLTAEELDERLPNRSFQISTTETRAAVVREVSDEAFGTALQRRLACEFDFVNVGETLLAETVGLELDGEASVRVQGDVRTMGYKVLNAEAVAAVAPTYREDIEAFEGGVMLGVKDLDPAITATNLQQRLGDILAQADFGRQAGNRWQVVGLGPAEDEKYQAFAVLVLPDRPELLSEDRTRAAFLSDEGGVGSALGEALRREDAMVLRSADPRISGQTAQLAIVAVVFSWLAIVAYLWVRFGSIRWGLAAVVCLVHDVIIVVGLVAISGWIYQRFGAVLGITSFKIDLPMVAALLTVIGYSVNDTIVVFDRIRENRGKLKTVSPNVINESINQTLPRTLLTSFTTFLVLIIMYVWGGTAIRPFSYALLTGILFGTYSSVAVASPLLLGAKGALLAQTIKPKDQAEGASA